MSIRLQHLREAFSFLSTFTGRIGELAVDTTNNRLQVHDGVTAGGWPAAKLSEVITNTRVAVSDSAYTALATDRMIAYTALTAARIVTLPAASAYPKGTQLIVIDESGFCSATNTITLSPSGSDTINGAASAILANAFGYAALESNGSNAWTITGQPSRQILTGNRTYFVSPSGNDGNNGLSSGTPFLTIQRAINATAAIDLSIYNVTIQLADGTYTSGATVTGPWIGSGTVTLTGDAVTPDNVIINVSSGACITVQEGGRLAVTNMKLVSSGSRLLNADGNAYISFANIDFGSSGSQHMNASDFSEIQATGNYKISGGSGYHARASAGGEIRIETYTITISGTPAFSGAFVQAYINSMVLIDGCTFSGSTTGTQYSAIANSTIYTNGAGSGYLPGSTAGSTASGGQYV